MIRRIRQFCRACFAGALTDEERGFVSRHLRPAESELFYGMDIIDQQHALAVARTIVQMAEIHRGVERGALIRLALLHDVGRRRGDLGIRGKVLAVLLDGFCPRWARAHARETGAWLFHMLYVYYHHASIGAGLLRSIGAAEDAAVIERHHAGAREDDPMELILLRRADEAN